MDKDYFRIPGGCFAAAALATILPLLPLIWGMIIMWGGAPAFFTFHAGVGGVVALVVAIRKKRRVGAVWSGVLIALAVLVACAGGDDAFSDLPRADTGNWFVLFASWCNYRLNHLFTGGLSTSTASGQSRPFFLTVSFTFLILGSVMMAFCSVMMAFWWATLGKSDLFAVIRDKGRYFLGVPIVAAIFAATLLAREIESPLIEVLQWFKAAGLGPGVTMLVLFGAVRLALAPFSVPHPYEDGGKRRWLTAADEFHTRAFVAGALVFVGDAFALCILMRAVTRVPAVWPFTSGDSLAVRFGAGPAAGLVVATILPMVIEIAVTGLVLWTWEELTEWMNENVLWWSDPLWRVDWFVYWLYLIAHSILLYVPLALALAFEAFPSPASFLVLWSFLLIKAVADVGSYVIPTAYRGLIR